MIRKNTILSNGIAVDQAASLPSPPRSGSQTGSHRARCRTQEPSRRWGLHLVRRNRIYYFRRRWPVILRHLGAPEFLSVSLRTHVLSEAVKRSADLLTAVEAGEKDVLTEIQDTPVNADRVRAMLQEIVRRAVAGMIARQEGEAPVDSSDVFLDRINAETRRIHDAQRARDWSVATAFAGETARQYGLDPDAVETPAVGRQVLSLLRRLNNLCTRVERDFDDPLHAGRDLLRDHDIAPTREALKPPMLLSDAIEKASEEAPRDVENKIRVVGKLALAFFGDVPVSSIVLEQSFDFLHMVWMLPKGWGKSHGRNRHGQEGRELCPLQEIRAADAKDAALLKEIMSSDTLSVPDKRRRLVQELTPRLTDGYLFVQRDMLNRCLTSAPMGQI